ncbi:restriction endonuclease [Desulfuribacillus alkaliarsenatis]|uniref:Uncharacterized protein n=1 Tax=Desulfuribacillus alkaliarsenatis TaxID=766136 RepID=A0A1E5G119_9FIRM|nr:restriction endonuclease [Desulfuribacillus alkaliarsenatis]OEF96561.1 hypothetical protein BHF68_07905 [Desulfuribacillus alkaliarsenatis]
MYNYHNLNDVEFEELCKDIMEKKLHTQLRIFAPGRDGGIDLTDNCVTHNIIVQVKHYINSKYSDLRNTLKKEIEKVKKLNPKHYYLCCGINLTSPNVREIFHMFSDYMDSDRNIITLKEIDEFLSKPENNEIVRKHYKLWLYASNILSEIYNQNIFIDCEVLFSDINEESNFFVQTTAYDECLDCLEKNRIIMMIGAPGVGKTITSKMLVLYFATQGYRIRYTTNGSISDLKKSLSAAAECKEVVLLDDCFGQHYFNMKDSQETELLYLAKYIKINPNKILILNSRITIYNEAKERSDELKMFIKGEKVKVHTIDMDLISDLEKAKIFYNHLIYNKIPNSYYEEIKQEKRYLDVVKHQNYTPRIIEYITTQYREIPPDQYYSFIKDSLDNPNSIWKNEYYSRLEAIDRVFMTTLYSITDTHIDYDVIKQCFNNRLSQMNGIDHTLNNFEIVLNRLNGSMLQITDKNGIRQIGVINPSVNDFLRSIFFSNDLELDSVRQSIVYHEQLTRCYSNEGYIQVLRGYLTTGTIVNMSFLTQELKSHFIVSNVCFYEIENEIYIDLIEDYLRNGINESLEKLYSKSDIVEALCSDPLCSFYDISNLICDLGLVKSILVDMELENQVATIRSIYELILQTWDFDSVFMSKFVKLCSDILITAINEYGENCDIPSYCDSFEIGQLAQEFKEDNEHEYGYDYAQIKEDIASSLEQMIEAEILEEIYEFISDLPESLLKNIDLDSIKFDINSLEVDSVVESFFEPSIDEHDGYRESSGESSISAIEAIFERI